MPSVGDLEEVNLEATEDSPLLQVRSSSSRREVRPSKLDDEEGDAGCLALWWHTAADYQPPPPQTIIKPQVVQPKLYFAAERTFLNWTHTVILLGMTSLSLVTTPRVGFIQWLMGALGLLVTLVFIAYSISAYHSRVLKLRQFRPRVDDTRGPLLLVTAVAIYATLSGTAHLGLRF
eukprot:TRINITY_DN42464_c0_g1_i1.p1 TRINITY_DN42464_c0_g1~~TRINITY_DN42464_c0_g1_i1.p1  ORF type:complete len:176 (+),score=29.33 TRINITY_DN42464_c0_g1_i1:31-558(+)